MEKLKAFGAEVLAYGLLGLIILLFFAARLREKFRSAQSRKKVAQYGYRRGVT